MWRHLIDNLIHNLIDNLIDNAARHNIPNGWIHIATATPGHGIGLAMASAGHSPTP